MGDNREFFKCTAGIAIKAIREIHSEHLKATDRSLSENLQRELKLTNQRVRDDAVAKLFSHLEINPNSIRRMLPPLIYIVESDNWSYDSSTKLNVIELLKGVQQDSRASRALTTWLILRFSAKKPSFFNPPAKEGKTIPIHRDLSGGQTRFLLVLCTFFLYERTTYYERIAEQRRIERNRARELGNKKKFHISCPNKDCQQKLRIPVTKNLLRITCPKCDTIFQYPRTQNPKVGQPINRHKQRTEQQRREQQEQLRRETEQRQVEQRYQETEQRRQQEIISKYGSLEAYKRHQNINDLKNKLGGSIKEAPLFWGFLGLVLIGLILRGC